MLARRESNEPPADGGRAGDAMLERPLQPTGAAGGLGVVGVRRGAVPLVVRRVGRPRRTGGHGVA